MCYCCPGIRTAIVIGFLVSSCYQTYINAEFYIDSNFWCVVGNDFETIFHWNLLSAWCPWSHLGKYKIHIHPLTHIVIWDLISFFVQVLIAVVSNLIWYGSLAPLVQENEQISVSLWRGFTVVTSSLAIFGRLFFNSAQVGSVGLWLFGPKSS